jgi:hypothetical protein
VVSEARAQVKVFMAALAAAVCLLAGSCRPNSPVESAAQAEALVQAHIDAINSKDAEKIHEFVNAYCAKSMVAVEPNMLEIGRRSAPFTFKKLVINSPRRLVALVEDAKRIRGNLTVYLDGKGKISGILMRPLPVSAARAQLIVDAHLDALNSKDAEKIHDFVNAYCAKSMVAVEPKMLEIGRKSAPFTFRRIAINSPGQVVAEVENGEGTRENLTVRFDGGGKVIYLLLRPA